jgi:polyribonucleotide nucleotidyltransferase
MMVEAGANEVSEDTVADAIAWAHQQIQPVIKLQEELRKAVAPAEQAYELVKPNEDIQTAAANWLADKLTDDLHQPYPERNELLAALKQEYTEHFSAEHSEEEWKELKGEYAEAFSLAMHQDVRKGIVEKGVRPDGRGLKDIRPLSSEVSVLPRTHGSSLFTRGLTQALNIVTLAPLSYAQIVDTMEVTDGERRYMHHYNAPGYTVGEVKRLGSPGRREIGHGYLAERALTAVLPSEEDFPYAIRSVTEIMSQNGSTSMAATCSSCLALMDAGVWKVLFARQNSSQSSFSEIAVADLTTTWATETFHFADCVARRIVVMHVTTLAVSHLHSVNDLSVTERCQGNDI